MENLENLIEDWCEQNKAWHFEGERGLKQLEKLFKALDSNYKSIEDFLYDNPGAMEAIVEWVRSINLREWKEALGVGKCIHCQEVLDSSYHLDRDGEKVCEECYDERME